jgi:hypothetical protein
MSKPQQPELARSGRGATDPHAVKTELTAPNQGGGERELGGPVPTGNLPGHHPEHDQDKPDGSAFIEKMHRLAEEEPASRLDDDAEVVHLREEERPTAEDGLADRLATAAGTPFKVAGDALQKVRDRL